jgi:CDP-diacylglycerol--glycerol-3-phosphate 3-phosphatidyltransferase
LLKLQNPTGNYLAVSLMILAAVTDTFDGRLARRLNQVSNYGRILDPVADKICVSVIALILVTIKDLPLWYVILIISRDLAILFFGFALVFKTKMVVESNIIGKVTVTALAIVVIAFTLDIGSLKWIFLWASVVLIAASSVSYLGKLLNIFRNKERLNKFEKPV